MAASATERSTRAAAKIGKDTLIKLDQLIAAVNALPPNISYTISAALSDVGIGQ